MEIKLQIGLFLVSFITLLVVLNSVVKNKMNIHYSMVWILWGIGMIRLSLFPQSIFYITKVLSIQMPVNTVFLVMIFLLYCLTFYVFLKLSKQGEEIINLNYEIASLKKKVDDLMEQNHD